MFHFTKQAFWDQWCTNTSQIEPVLKCNKSRIILSTLFQFVYIFSKLWTVLCICSLSVLSILLWKDVTVFTVFCFPFWFQSGLEGRRFLLTFVQMKSILGMMACDFIIEVLPFPIRVSFSFRKVPTKIANHSNQNGTGKKKHNFLFKKGHEKLKKRLTKNPQLFFYMEPGSSSGLGQRCGAKPEPHCENKGPASTVPTTQSALTAPKTSEVQISCLHPCAQHCQGARAGDAWQHR